RSADGRRWLNALLSGNASRPMPGPNTSSTQNHVRQRPRSALVSGHSSGTGAGTGGSSKTLHNVVQRGQRHGSGASVGKRKPHFRHVEGPTFLDSLAGFIGTLRRGA